MYCVVVCLILELICGSLHSVSAKGNHLPFTNKPIPAETPRPVDIDTSHVENITTLPLVLVLGVEEKAQLTNTGYSVEEILTSSFTSSFAFGGALYPNFYLVSRQVFYFTNETGGNSGTTVDGKGGQKLEVVAYFYNIKYGSFENALNYRDGLFEIITRIIVGGSVPNFVFDAFIPYFKKIAEAGSSVELPILPTYLFYNLVPNELEVQYYAFPGAYTDEATGKQYYCTTTIVKEVLPYRFISQQQYDASFGLLKNENGEPLITAPPQAPFNDRPVVSTKGIIEFLSFFGIFKVNPGKM